MAAIFQFYVYMTIFQNKMSCKRISKSDKTEYNEYATG